MEVVDHLLFNFSLASDEMQLKLFHPFKINVSEPSFVINKNVFDCKSKIEEMNTKRDHHYQTL